jgi:protease-4
MIHRLLMLVCLSMLLTACGPMTLVIGNTADQKLKTKVVQRDPGHIDGRVAIIDITGTISNYAKPGLLREGENPVSLMYEKLQEARTDKRVKAVILRINSPGGTVTASDAIYRQIMQFKHDTGKPVIALFMDLAASGAYYVSCSADHIVAYPTSITASIGVILQTISIKPALQRWGIEPKAITSGPNKAAGSPLEQLNEEQQQILQQLVDDFYKQFVHTVTISRTKVKATDMPWLTDGRVISGSTAVQVGLADELGDLQTAFAVAKKMAKMQHAELVRYHRPLAYVGSPYASSPVNAPGTQINIASLNMGDGLMEHGEGFYYLWPGFSGNKQ